MTKWRLELRDDRGYEEGSDTFVGTEQEAMEDARKWLAEMQSLVSYRREMLVINTDTDEVVYQGTFGK